MRLIRLSRGPSVGIIVLVAALCFPVGSLFLDIVTLSEGFVEFYLAPHQDFKYFGNVKVPNIAWVKNVTAFARRLKLAQNDHKKNSEEMHLDDFEGKLKKSLVPQLNPKATDFVMKLVNKVLREGPRERARDRKRRNRSPDRNSSQSMHPPEDPTVAALVQECMDYWLKLTDLSLRELCKELLLPKRTYVRR